MVVFNIRMHNATPRHSINGKYPSHVKRKCNRFHYPATDILFIVRPLFRQARRSAQAPKAHGRKQCFPHGREIQGRKTQIKGVALLQAPLPNGAVRSVNMSVPRKTGEIGLEST